MAEKWQNANVGTSGRRRLVPMMGIDFIAGNIERKQPEYGAGGSGVSAIRYGRRPACIGGRTRKWSNINFIQVTPSGARRNTPVKASELQQRQYFAIASQSAAATIMNPAAIAALQADWRAGSTRKNKDSKAYATLRGWVTAVRLNQLYAEEEITPTTNTWPPQE